jgi:Spy/CpxP family protein refolding chaperone
MQRVHAIRVVLALVVVGAAAATTAATAVAGAEAWCAFHPNGLPGQKGDQRGLALCGLGLTGWAGGWTHTHTHTYTQIGRSRWMWATRAMRRC